MSSSSSIDISGAIVSESVTTKKRKAEGKVILILFWNISGYITLKKNRFRNGNRRS